MALKNKPNPKMKLHKRIALGEKIKAPIAAPNAVVKGGKK